MRHGYHSEGTGAGIPVLKGLRDLEQIHRGDQSWPGIVPGVGARLGQAEEGATGRLSWSFSYIGMSRLHLLGIVLVDGLGVFQLVPFFKTAAEKKVQGSSMSLRRTFAYGEGIFCSLKPQSLLSGLSSWGALF